MKLGLAAKKALESLLDYHKYDEDKISVAIDVLQAALAEQDSGSVCARCGGIVHDPVIEQAEQGPVGEVVSYHQAGLYDELPIGTKLFAAPVQQAEQEPEVWYCPNCGTLSEAQVKCCPDWIRSRKVPKNFALTCKATFDRNEQAEQESETETIGVIMGGELVALVEEYQTGAWPIYAAPVRTKDLTDSEIEELHWGEMCNRDLSFARAVIAADRELNK